VGEHKVAVKAAWIALFLTSGEFIVSFWLFVHDGHLLALYLAITYAVRETPSGKEYHTIIVNLVKHAKEHWLTRKH
jgi:hypothetical protein